MGASALVLGMLLSSWLAKAFSPYISVGEAGVANQPRIADFAFMSTSASIHMIAPALTDVATNVKFQSMMLVRASSSTWTITPVPSSMVTATPKLASMVVPKSVAKLTEAPATSMTWVTWTATTMGVATDVATPTAGVRSAPSSPLLDRLVKNKPSIWGNKGLYVLLGALYLTLLGLFLKRILDTLKRRRDLHGEFTHNSRIVHTNLIDKFVK